MHLLSSVWLLIPRLEREVVEEYLEWNGREQKVRKLGADYWNWIPKWQYGSIFPPVATHSTASLGLRGFFLTERDRKLDV